jgi:hypothetical protein
MRFSALLFLVLVFALAGCEPAANVTNFVPPPPSRGADMCLNACRQGEDYCLEGCDLAQRSCTQKIQEQAMQDYDKYTREQFAEGGDIDLYPHDFERLAPCNKARTQCASDCENDYKACYSGCGGKVFTTTTCQVLCY